MQPQDNILTIKLYQWISLTSEEWVTRTEVVDTGIIIDYKDNNYVYQTNWELEWLSME